MSLIYITLENQSGNIMYCSSHKKSACSSCQETDSSTYSAAYNNT